LPGSQLLAPGSLHAPAWHYPFVAVLVAVMILGIVQRARRWRRKHDTNRASC